MNALVSKKIFLGILCIKGWSNDSDVGKERLLKVWIFRDNDGCELYLFFEAIIINYGKILNIKYFKEKHVKCNVICKNIKHMKGTYLCRNWNGIYKSVTNSVHPWWPFETKLIKFKIGFPIHNFVLSKQYSDFSCLYEIKSHVWQMWSC